MEENDCNAESESETMRNEPFEYLFLMKYIAFSIATCSEWNMVVK